MPPHDPLEQLQALDAVASEQDMLLAFRVCDESEELEPVFLQIFSAGGGTDRQAALVAITDEAGLSLGRYVIDRRRLEAALDAAEDVTAEDPEPAVVPAEWDAV